MYYSLATSKSNGLNPSINSVTFHDSYEAAVTALKATYMTDNQTGSVQIGSGTGSLAMTREPNSSWLVCGEIWSMETIQEAGELSTLTVPLARNKQTNLRLGWGLGKWIPEMFAEKYGMTFLGEGVLSSDRSNMKFRCTVPRDTEVLTALKYSYGCTVVRLEVIS